MCGRLLLSPPQVLGAATDVTVPYKVRREDSWSLPGCLPSCLLSSQLKLPPVRSVGGKFPRERKPTLLNA